MSPIKKAKGPEKNHKKSEGLSSLRDHFALGKSLGAKGETVWKKKGGSQPLKKDWDHKGEKSLRRKTFNGGGGSTARQRLLVYTNKKKTRKQHELREGGKIFGDVRENAQPGLNQHIWNRGGSEKFFPEAPRDHFLMFDPKKRKGWHFLTNGRKGKDRGDDLRLKGGHVRMERPKERKELKAKKGAGRN